MGVCVCGGIKLRAKKNRLTFVQDGMDFISLAKILIATTLVDTLNKFFLAKCFGVSYKTNIASIMDTNFIQIVGGSNDQENRFKNTIYAQMA